MKVRENKQTLAGVVFIGWLTLVFAAYFVVNKPFTPEQLFMLLNKFWQVFLMVITLALAGGIGQTIAGKTLGLLPARVNASLSAGIGFGALALFTLTWGSTIGVNLSLWIIPGVLILVFHKAILAWGKLMFHEPGSPTPDGRLIRGIQIAIAILFIGQFFVALSPPLKFDCLTYHYYLPQSYILEGRISYNPEIMFWGMPQLNEMIYTLLMVAGGVNAAALYSWVAGVLTTLALVRFAEKLINPQSAWVAAASLVAGQTQINLIGSGYVEWPIMLFGLGIVCFLFLWLRNQNPAALYLSGVFAGLALSSKYTAGVGLLACIAVVALFSTNPAKRIKNIALVGGLATLIFSPWLIKNFLATGNPFYPILLPTQHFDEIRMAFYQFAPREQDWSRILLLPWQATILGVENRDGYSASIGPLLLILSPFGILFFKRFSPETQELLKVAAALTGITLAIWAIGSQFRGLLIQTRLYMVVFPAWAILAGLGYESVQKIHAGQIRTGFIGAAFILLSLVFVVYGSIGEVARSGAIAYVLGNMSENRFMEHNTGQFSKVMTDIEKMPQNTKVLMLWETRSYYCAEKCDSDEIIDRWFHDLRYYKHTATIKSTWEQQGYTHLLLHVRGEIFVREQDKNAPFTPADWLALELLKASLTVEKVYGQDYILYSLKD